jgi:hypothetical protein
MNAFVRKLTVGSAACLGLIALAGCAGKPDSVVIGAPPTLAPINDYCAAAQKEIASARVPARNVILNDYQAFARATPSVKPLETLQYTGYADDKRTKPRMISCKFTSSERIRSEYGATAAGEASTCARLNRRTLDAVMLTLTDRQKKKMPFKGAVPVMLEADEQATSEAQWLEAFTMVQADAGGTLRIRAKSLGVAGPNVRVRTGGNGRMACHLIAPEYLKRILIGEVQLPTPKFPDAKQTASR